MDRVEYELPRPATGERGGVFGSAAAAITIHGITAATATPGALITPDTLAFHAASATATTPAGYYNRVQEKQDRLKTSYTLSCTVFSTGSYILPNLRGT